MSLIAGLSGIVASKTLDRVVLRVGGVSFSVAAPLPLLSQLVVGDTAELHTHLLVREDDLALFGFGSEDERDLFVTLLGVSGVGARLGLAMLSNHSPDALRQAIASEDLDRLTRTPGIGKKLAQRIVLELKPVISKQIAHMPAIPGGDTSSADARESDVIEALTGLGYSAAEAQSALRAIPDMNTMALDEVIVRALRLLAR